LCPRVGFSNVPLFLEELSMARVAFRSSIIPAGCERRSMSTATKAFTMGSRPATYAGVGAILLACLGTMSPAKATVYDVSATGVSFWGQMTVTGTFNSDGDFDYQVMDYTYSYTFTNVTGLTLPSEIPQSPCVIAGGCPPPTPVYATLSGGARRSGYCRIRFG